MARIPFNRPYISGREFEYIQIGINEKQHLSGDGFFSKKCHAFLEALLGVPKVLLTSSCTDALEMAALLLRLQAGDEVIVPAFTFVSTVNAFVLHGARPIFVDIRPDTLNLDEKQLERAITPHTRAIVPVHYAGVGCEMDAIHALAEQHGITIIEDNAHGLFGRYKGRYLGTFGQLATQSFHETKNIMCGEGGALVINDPAYVERAEIIREKGTNRSRFFRGQVDKYTWVDVGSSYLLSDLSAAFLFAQLESYEDIQARRREIWETYYAELSDWAEGCGVRMPYVPTECEQSYHLFYLILPSLEDRTRFIAHLDRLGIDAVFHYQPLHLSEMGVKFGGKAGDCPVTESISDRLVRLPFFYQLSQTDQARVIEAIRKFG